MHDGPEPVIQIAAMCTTGDCANKGEQIVLSVDDVDTPVVCGVCERAVPNVIR